MHTYTAVGGCLAGQCAHLSLPCLSRPCKDLTGCKCISLGIQNTLGEMGENEHFSSTLYMLGAMLFYLVASSLCCSYYYPSLQLNKLDSGVQSGLLFLAVQHIGCHWAMVKMATLVRGDATMSLAGAMEQIIGKAGIQIQVKYFQILFFLLQESVGDPEGLKSS